ncbi:MAG TPA: hypothetical protein VFE18_12880 [Phenylobacterium sp.]|jgi:hypothetical protein|uniref:hypothetical protein n=1 Tax=Phenylobacterium sp. TaxID=1871053 RepID=UPI002D45F6F7|nr:hypothetical protein [Phenylobacterium sp.]HZZ69059.1 hypothetical protein [Phenylobacterium sp.]
MENTPGIADASGAGDPAARMERHLRLLQELAELGMRMARAVTEQVVAQGADEGSDAGPGDSRLAGDPGMVFSRIARAVRLTLVLEAKLAEELADKERIDRSEAVRRARAIAQAPYREREEHLRRAVARAIRRDLHDQDEETLFDTLNEEIDDWSRTPGFLDRPIGELAALICKDLGLTASPALWEHEAWALEEAAARNAAPDPHASALPETQPPDPPGSAHHPPDGGRQNQPNAPPPSPSMGEG